MSLGGDSVTVYCHPMPDEFMFIAVVVLWMIGVVAIVVRKLTIS